MELQKFRYTTSTIIQQQKPNDQSKQNINERPKISQQPKSKSKIERVKQWICCYKSKKIIDQNQGQSNKTKDINSIQRIDQMQKQIGSPTNDESAKTKQAQQYNCIEVAGSIVYQMYQSLRQSYKKVCPGKKQQWKKIALNSQGQIQWLAFQHVDQKLWQIKQFIWKHCLIIRENQQVIHKKQAIVNFYKSTNVSPESLAFIKSIPACINQVNQSYIMPVFRVGQYTKLINNQNINFHFYVTKEPILTLADIICQNEQSIKQQIRNIILKMIISFFKQIIQLGYFLECLSLLNIVFLQKTQVSDSKPKKELIDQLKQVIFTNNVEEFQKNYNVEEFQKNYNVKVVIDLRHIKKIEKNQELYTNQANKRCSFLVGLIYLGFFLKNPINGIQLFTQKPIPSIHQQPTKQKLIRQLKIEKKLIKQLKISSKLLQQGKIHPYAFYQIRKLTQAKFQKRWSLQEFHNSVVEQFKITESDYKNMKNTIKLLFQKTIRKIEKLQHYHVEYWDINQKQLNNFRMIPYIKMICCQKKKLEEVEVQLKNIEQLEQNVYLNWKYVIFYIQKCIHFQNLIIQQEKYEFSNRQLFKISFKQYFPEKILDQNKPVYQQIDIQTACQKLKTFTKAMMKKLTEKQPRPIFQNNTKCFGQNLIIANFYQDDNQKMKYVEVYEKIAKKLSKKHQLSDKNKQVSERLWKMLNDLFRKQDYVGSNISSPKSNESIQGDQSKDSTKSIRIQLYNMESE